MLANPAFFRNFVGENMEATRSKHILVTGAYGQLGWELSKILDRATAVFVDRDVLDITDGSAVKEFLQGHRFSHVVNCAAYTAVDKAESESEACRQINVGGLKNIIEAISQTDTRLINISTDFVFDGLKDQPYTEEDAVCPLSVYGKTKAEGERIVLSECPEAIVLRTGWLYSVHGHNFVKTILNRALDGQPLKVVDDQMGTPTWAADLAGVIKKILEAPHWVPGLYNYSNAGMTSWYEFARAIVETAGIKAEISPCATGEYPATAKRPAFSELDKSKIIKTYAIDIPQWRDSLIKALSNIRERGLIDLWSLS